MNRFEQQLRDDAQRTNQALYACLKTSGRDPQEAVFQAMRYSLLDAGKRLGGCRMQIQKVQCLLPVRWRWCTLIH